MSLGTSLGPFKTLSRLQRLGVWVTLGRRRAGDAWAVYSRNRLAVFGLALLALFILMAIAHPILLKTVWPKRIYDPVVGHDLKIFPHPSPPSPAHLLGTDTLGRDVLSILLAATTPTLLMALTAALTTALVGTLAAAVSAYFGGLADGFISHLADLSLLAPAPLVMVVVGFMLDISPLEFGVIYGVLAGIGGVMIVLRSHALTVMTRPFVDAARVAGAGPLHIISRHLVPHMLPLASVNMMLTVTGAVFANGFVAFLGLSRAQLNWGSMIYDSFTYQAVNAAITWNVLIPSAMAISFFAMAFYFIARGLHDVADPRQAERLANVRRRRRLSEPAPGKARSAVSVPVKAPTQVASQAEHARAIYQGPPSPDVLPAALPAGSVTAGSSPMGATLAWDDHLKPGEVVTVSFLSAKLWVIGGASEDWAASPGAEKALPGLGSLFIRLGGAVQAMHDGKVMVVFGLYPGRAPFQVGALLATHAGLELYELVARQNERRAVAGLPSLAAGAGIATGYAEVYAIRSGSGGEMDQPGCSLRSPALEIAWHLQRFTSAVASGTLLISQETYRYLESARTQFIFGRQGPAQFPGIEGVQTVYQVTGRRQRLHATLS